MMFHDVPWYCSTIIWITYATQVIVAIHNQCQSRHMLAYESSLRSTWRSSLPSLEQVTKWNGFRIPHTSHPFHTDWCSLAPTYSWCFASWENAQSPRFYSSFLNWEDDVNWVPPGVALPVQFWPDHFSWFVNLFITKSRCFSSHVHICVCCNTRTHALPITFLNDHWLKEGCV